MHVEKKELGIEISLEVPFQEAIEAVTAALKTEGFGVLTEIDVKTTLKNKLDVEFRPYKILGACNPSLAYRALTSAPEIGLLLPCNVTVSQENEVVKVAIIDPIAMMDVVEHPALTEIAEEAQSRLRRVAAQLAGE